MLDPLTCTKCNKRLSRKRARLVEGKVMCSACLFPEIVRGIPMRPNDTPSNNRFD